MSVEKSCSNCGRGEYEPRNPAKMVLCTIAGKAKRTWHYCEDWTPKEGI